ncbi:MAG: NAD-dependent epimerase/dehydratase family protein [Bacteroidetes bacterium]|nr:NAD-dependent epimerase/dehydratase family protein [Bacteroidota bacterium]MBU1718831.1 NAD-dependent epimerase/dehydratase family protein [Bacteroidota bacterium]
MKGRILITGASGFIGKFLVRYFSLAGYNVVALMRSIPEEKERGVEYVRYDLREGFQEKWLEGATALVHCAYLKYSVENRDSDEVNFGATREILDCTMKHPEVHFVYLSSFAAHEGASGHYGKSKLAIEKLLENAGTLVLKPGLVCGDGGIYSALSDGIRKSRFIPLLGSGAQPLQLVHISEVAEVIRTGIERKIIGKYAIADNRVITFRDLYRTLAAKQGRKIYFLPLPWFLFALLIWLLRIFYPGLGFSVENLRGMKDAKSYNTKDSSDIFGISFGETDRKTDV